MDTEEGKLYHNKDDYTCVTNTGCGELFPFAFKDGDKRNCIAECPALPVPLWSFEHEANGGTPAYKSCVKSCEDTNVDYYSVEKGTDRRCVVPKECTENAPVGLQYFGDSSEPIVDG